MRLQKKSLREALFAIYAFCRTLDDIADSADSQEQKKKSLDQWRLNIETLYSTDRVILFENTHPLVHVMSEIIPRFGLPRAPFDSLISGMEMDVNGPLVAPCWPKLEEYCRYVAGSVGELCLAVWGWHGPDALTFARHTGEAFQLTNILRDLHVDAANSRLYLPEGALQEANIESRDALTVSKHPNLEVVCLNVSRRANDYYNSASKLWKQHGPPSARPAWGMLCMYRALFKKVMKLGFGDDQQHVHLSTIEKLYHISRAYMTV